MNCNDIFPEITATRVIPGPFHIPADPTCDGCRKKDKNEGICIRRTFKQSCSQIMRMKPMMMSNFAIFDRKPGKFTIFDKEQNDRQV